MQGYKTQSNIYLIWHDGLEVVKALFSNPVYEAKMPFDPIHI